MSKNLLKTKNILTNSLIILASIIGIILIMSVFMGIPYIFNNIGNTEKLVDGIGMFILGIIYFIMIIFLAGIASSSRYNIFVIENVKRFKNIGYLLFINLLLDYIYMLLNGVSGTRIIDIAPGIFITGSMAMYFIAGLLCIVIADAFEQAIKIKEDNDLTI